MFNWTALFEYEKVIHLIDKSYLSNVQSLKIEGPVPEEDTSYRRRRKWIHQMTEKDVSGLFRRAYEHFCPSKLEV